MAQKKKKTSKKKTTKRENPKSLLNAKGLERFKQLLLQKRRELISDVNEIENEALKKSRLDASGDLSSMPIHMADLGTDNYEQEFALGLVNSERALLEEINAALERVENGTYGICEGTNKPITVARLEARPWAKYSVEYARKLELGLIEEETS